MTIYIYYSYIRYGMPDVPCHLQLIFCNRFDRFAIAMPRSAVQAIQRQEHQRHQGGAAQTIPYGVERCR